MHISVCTQIPMMQMYDMFCYIIHRVNALCVTCQNSVRMHTTNTVKNPGGL